ncbi:hypothetical protein QQ020_10220 [Fulvivirgaceae bacterium BMA12]|uniref:Uncharacterized protein n=1 Tax=Agaribacillus aureus TaxID=3051825 RepID=A0ABT8L3S5_9BACT|nr:hypothetical protein [Fulvivirgaceae bacterium BMA12]
MKTNDIIKITVIALLITFTAFGIDGIKQDIKALSHYSWQFLSNLLIVVVLYLYTIKSSYSNKLLWFSLWGILFIIGHFNILVEALIFNITSRNQTFTALMRGFFSSGILSYLLYHFLGRDKENQQESVAFARRSTWQWVVKVLLGNIIYFLFYFAAGMTLSLVYPQLMDFYGDKIPPLHQIIITNLCFRGFIFVGIAILIDLTTLSSALYKGILTGLIFAVIGGIAPLVIPNDLMPQNIRVAHGFEVGISNFLYGWILQYLLARKKQVLKV